MLHYKSWKSLYTVLVKHACFHVKECITRHLDARRPMPDTSPQMPDFQSLLHMYIVHVASSLLTKERYNSIESHTYIQM